MHLLVPGVLAWLFFRTQWKKAWLVFLLTMAVDLDHLLATPIFDPQRCSIGFHPLHSEFAIGVYAAMLVIPNKVIRMVSVGLLFHMLTDFIDCLLIV